MAHGRHSYIAFYPSDWLAGTARLPRLHRSIYFDICCCIWDTAKPVSERELALMVADTPNAHEIVEDLILMGKLDRADDGSITNAKALAEAEKAFEAWTKMSEAGKARQKAAAEAAAKGAGKGAGNPPASEAGIEPEPEPEPTSPSGEGDARARKSLCPEDFWPSPSEGSKTAEKMAGWSQHYLEQQVEKFIAHHRAKGNRSLDWNRSWTTWAINSFDERKDNGKGSGGDDFSRELERRLRAGGD